jgi:hypothetical protein
MNAQQLVKINNYKMDIVLQDSAVSISADMTLSYTTKSKSIFLLFNSCVEIQVFYINNQSVDYFIQNDTIWFSKPADNTAQLHVRYTISNSMVYDTTRTGFSPHPQECSRIPLLYNHWQMIFERWHRWYPVLYDNFAQYNIRITIPLSFKAFAFVPADSIKHSDNSNIHYFTLFDEDFPILIASMDVCRKETINEKGINFNFYFIPEHHRLLKVDREKKELIFTDNLQQKDSLLQIISRRCIDAFFWYNDNLWQKDIKNINIIESSTSAGFGLGDFILVNENSINMEFFFPNKLSHEIAHIWLGLHVEYETVGKYFLGESVTEYVNLLFYESWAEKEDFEKSILSHKELKEIDIQNFTVSFDEILQSRKHTVETSEAIIYAKGPIFLHEFRKLIGKEKFLQIIIDTYKEDNKLITMKDFEYNIKKYKCWKEYKQLFKMRL